MLLLSAGLASAQKHDVLTPGTFSGDVAKLQVRLAMLGGSEAVTLGAEKLVSHALDEWAIVCDSIQSGLRDFGEDYGGEEAGSGDGDGEGTGSGEDGSSEKKRYTPLEFFWLAHGLYNQVKDLIDLYVEFVDRSKEKDYAFGALQDETVHVFFSEGKNATKVFERIYFTLKDQARSSRQMSQYDCYTMGKQLSEEVKRINVRLKFQMRRVHRFEMSRVPNDVLNRASDYYKDKEGHQVLSDDFDPSMIFKKE